MTGRAEDLAAIRDSERDARTHRAHQRPAVVSGLAETLGVSALAEGLVQRAQRVDDLQQSTAPQGNEFGELLETVFGPAITALLDGVVDELPASTQVRGNLDRLKFGDPLSYIHKNLLTLHGRRTRYVTGALFLTACWWMQRKAWARRAAALTPRPSGTTGGAA